MLTLFIISIVALIISLVFVFTTPKDVNKEASNTLNDAYLYGVWGIEQPHFDND